MKLVVAIVRPEKANEVLEALFRLSKPGLKVLDLVQQLLVRSSCEKLSNRSVMGVRPLLLLRSSL